MNRQGRSALALLLACIALAMTSPAAAQTAPAQQLEEKLMVLPLPIPVLAYVVRPLSAEALPLVVMNHGESLDSNERSFFPIVEFRAMARWFARRGHLVVVPVRPGFGAAALTSPEKGMFGAYLGTVGDCSDPDFRAPGLAVASLDQWVIDHFLTQKLALPRVIVVGQSGGGWGAIALSSRNPQSVRAIVTFEAGRGGRVGGKPNNNCAPDRLVETAREFGKTARVPLLMIYTENDTYFGPTLSRRLFDAYREAGGKVRYRLFPAFGEEGHFFADARDAIAIWEPVVSEFLEEHP